MNVHVKNFNSPRVSKKVLELLSKLSKFTGYKITCKIQLYFLCRKSLILIRCSKVNDSKRDFPLPGNRKYAFNDNANNSDTMFQGVTYTYN